jgi:uncharacterized protein with von Willebrand factor type A (vWA) domain
MPGLVSTLVDELRAVGIPISVGEHIDAASAVASVPLQEKEVLRAALQGALVKSAEHLSAFNMIFDLYTSRRSPTAEGEGEGPNPLSDLSDEELRDALREAMGGDDDLLQSMLADEYVRRFADIEPGRPVAGVMYGIQVNQAADLDGIREDLLQRLGEGGGDEDGEGGTGGGSAEGGGGGGGGGRNRSRGGGRIEEGLPGVRSLRDRLARAEVDRAVDKFRDEIEASIRRALVADRGARAVRQTLRVGLAEDADIASASSAELAAMTAAIGPLAQQLTQVLNQQANYRKRKLSIRGTLRKAMGSGGIPFRIATEPARPPKPDFVVLCDVSGSVASFSRFTLALLIALDSRLSRLRVFSFVDGVADITGMVQEARASGRPLDGELIARESTRFTGSSDYGRVMREFAAEYVPQLTRRSVVLIVGDARSNYTDSSIHAFAQIQEHAGMVYWLNPEPKRAWNEGDSIIAEYARFCHQVEECRNLRQITDFVSSLAAHAR